MINSINIALSALNAATQKVGTAASNIANVTTAGSLEDGGQPPYTPVTVQQTTTGNGGVAAKVIPKDNPFSAAYAPDSSFADENGIVGVPNVDLAEESVNLILAETQYKAALKIIETESDLSNELLRTLDKKA